MRTAFFVLIIALTCLAGCNKSPASSASSANSADPVEMKLQELAGSGASNCGHLKSQATDQMDAAAKCATQAAKDKRPFYIAYELPGMTIGVAGNSEGKLFTLQSQGSQAGNGSGLASGACPSELRVAPSGRVTCFAPGTFGMGMDASHGGMTMPPAMGQNPHASSGALPPGHPAVNPNANAMPKKP